VIIEIDALKDAVLRGIDSMFLDAESDLTLANRIRQREGKVLEAMSNAQGRDLLEWCQAIFAISDAPERELFDLEYLGNCSGCEGKALVLVRALNAEGHPIIQADMCTDCAEALGGEGAIRDFRRRTLRA